MRTNILLPATEAPAQSPAAAMVDAASVPIGRSDAGVRADSREAQMPAKFLSFCLGSEEYGIDILRVQQIGS